MFRREAELVGSNPKAVSEWRQKQTDFSRHGLDLTQPRPGRKPDTQRADGSPGTVRPQTPSSSAGKEATPSSTGRGSPHGTHPLGGFCEGPAAGPGSWSTALREGRAQEAFPPAFPLRSSPEKGNSEHAADTGWDKKCRPRGGLPVWRRGCRPHHLQP